MPRATHTSPVLLCVIAIALATGAGASLVASATRPVGGAVIASAPYSFSDTLLGLLLIAPFLAVFGALIFRRIREGGLGFPQRAVMTGLVVFVLLVGFAVVGHYLNPGSPLATQSSTGTGTGTGGGSPGNGSGGGGGGPSIGSPSSSFDVSGGLLLVVAAVVALALAGLILPTLGARIAGRRVSRAAAANPAVARAGAQAALARARSDLDAGTDPRAVIEHLYTQLLDRMVPIAGDLSACTPEEIRSEKLVPLGVRPAAADALTRLFEEARYSSHALGPEAANRVRSAVGAAAKDLARIPAAR
jgi:hypothetical protein